MSFLLNIRHLELLQKEIQQKGIGFSVIRSFNKKYGTKIKAFKKCQIFDLATKIEENYKERAKDKELKKTNQRGNFWAKGESKLFCLILPYFFSLYKLSLQDLKLTDLFPLCQIFLLRNDKQLLFKINQFLLPSPSKKNVSWTKEQQAFFKEYMIDNETNSKNLSWKQISFEDFSFNEFKIYRSPRQCRQKWLNHLNPSIIKDKWSIREDIQLLKVASQYGSKWSLIARALNSGRTQNMVKNRVISLVKQACKKKYKKIKKGQIIIALKAIQTNSLILSLSQTQIAQQNPEISNDNTNTAYSQLRKGCQDSGTDAICTSVDASFSIENQLNFRSPMILIQDEGENSWQYEQSAIFSGVQNFFAVVPSEPLF